VLGLCWIHWFVNHLIYQTHNAAMLSAFHPTVKHLLYRCVTPTFAGHYVGIKQTVISIAFKTPLKSRFTSASTRWLYWFHTKLSSHILQQNWVHAFKMLVLILFRAKRCTTHLLQLRGPLVEKCWPICCFNRTRTLHTKWFFLFKYRNTGVGKIFSQRENWRQ